MFHAGPRIGGGAGKGPKLEALRVDLGKVSQTLHHTNWVRVKSRFANVEMLNRATAMTIADVDGVIIAGLLFDAGETNSHVLLEVGPSGSKASHARNPISLHDVFFRVGGAAVGRASVNLRINSNDTIVDHTWICRADHGAGVGWNSNTSANELVVEQRAIRVVHIRHRPVFRIGRALQEIQGGNDPYALRPDLPHPNS